MDIGETIADEALQEEGVWIKYGEDGARFLIASAQRKKYRDKLGKLSWKARRLNRGRDLSPSAAEAVTSEALLDTVLLDWDGLEYSAKVTTAPGWSADKVGQPFPYSLEHAKWYISKAPEIRDFIWSEASNIDNFQQKDGEQEEEPASTPLADTKSGSEISTGTG